MKINIRIILITFVVVVLVSISIALIFYSVSNSVITSQNTKTLLNSANDFVFEFEQSAAHIDEEFGIIYRQLQNKEQIKLDTLDIDFFFKVNIENKIDPKSFSCKPFVLFNYQPIELASFIEQNPGTILRYSYVSKNETYFYGRIINEKLLTDISKRIRAELSVFVGSNLLSVSNSQVNIAHNQSLKESFEQLKFKNNFDVANIESNNYNFFSVKYELKSSLQNTQPVTFIVFNISSDIKEFGNTLKTILSVTILTSILISLIVTILFTSKFRKQISLLINAAEKSSQGDLKFRVPIVSKDEIGTLSDNFNKMLDKISEKEKLNENYSDFISLINLHSDLTELSKAALDAICKTLNIHFGVLYLFENNLLIPLAEEGLTKSVVNPFEENSVYSAAVKNAETIELSFKENNPVLKTSSLTFPVKYTLIKPVVQNKKIIAVLELISEHIPEVNPKEYLNVITEQLGIALNNALSYHQLKKIVGDLKTLNENYQKQNEQIKGQNQQLTELHNQLKIKAEELEAERQKAIELSNVKSQFLANMSHELKTPLSSIIGLTEIILNDTSTIPRNRNRLQVVFRNGKRLLEMINNILEFSKIDSGKISVNKSTFLISSEIKNIVLSFGHYLTENKIKLNVFYDSDNDYLVKTDKEKFAHILTNLLSNAFKFTESGSVTVSVNSKMNNMIIKVTDTGIGIPQEDISKIFNEFERAMTSEKSKYGGAGLGLAICKKYVEMLGGKIDVESQIGSGTTFTVSLFNSVLDVLPLSENITETASSKIIETKEVLLQNEETSPSNTDETKVLVVDDDLDILFTVGEILQNIGFSALFARNGVECLSILAKEKINIVLLDIMMPEMDGFETIKRIRKDEKLNDLQVIALTAHAMLDDKHIIEQSGFDDVVTKPVDVTSLKIKINQANMKVKSNEK
jgi:two-component system chemotaxis sensor kinase CheA